MRINVDTLELDDQPAKSPKIGQWIVVNNGTMEEIVPEDPHLFTDESEMQKYVEEQATRYPGLQFLVCPIERIVTGKRQILTTTGGKKVR